MLIINPTQILNLFIKTFPPLFFYHLPFVLSSNINQIYLFNQTESTKFLRQCHAVIDGLQLYFK